jgi:hypothetical protein
MSNPYKEHNRMGFLGLFLIFLTPFVVWACNGGTADTVTITKTEYGKLIGDSTLGEYPKKVVIKEKVYHIHRGSDGHDYLMTYNEYYDTPLHYIECTKCGKKW